MVLYVFSLFNISFINYYDAWLLRLWKMIRFENIIEL